MSSGLHTRVACDSDGSGTHRVFRPVQLAGLELVSPQPHSFLRSAGPGRIPNRDVAGARPARQVPRTRRDGAADVERPVLGQR